MYTYAYIHTYLYTKKSKNTTPQKISLKKKNRYHDGHKKNIPELFSFSLSILIKPHILIRRSTV